MISVHQIWTLVNFGVQQVLMKIKNMLLAWETGDTVHNHAHRWMRSLEKQSQNHLTDRQRLHPKTVPGKVKLFPYSETFYVYSNKISFKEKLHHQKL